MGRILHNSAAEHVAAATARLEAVEIREENARRISSAREADGAAGRERYIQAILDAGTRQAVAEHGAVAVQAARERQDWAGLAADREMSRTAASRAARVDALLAEVRAPERRS